MLATGRGQKFEKRRQTRKEDKKPPRWQAWMQKGDDPKITFVVGLLLSFPGASYLVALDTLHKQHYSTFATVLVVFGICLAGLMLLEIPLVVWGAAAKQTLAAIDRAKAWASAHGRRIAIWGLTVIAVGLVATASPNCYELFGDSSERPAGTGNAD